MRVKADATPPIKPSLSIVTAEPFLWFSPENKVASFFSWAGPLPRFPRLPKHRGFCSSQKHVIYSTGSRVLGSTDVWRVSRRELGRRDCASHNDHGGRPK